MLRKITSTLTTIIIALIFQSCIIFEDPDSKKPGENVEAWIPVYASSSSTEIKRIPVEPAIFSGTPITYKDLLIIIESGEKVHLFDNIDPENPVQKASYRMPGINELSIRNDIVYVSQFSDLVAIELTPTFEINELKRIKDVISNFQNVPPPFGYFECIDSKKGIVIRWELEFREKVFCFN